VNDRRSLFASLAGVSGACLLLAAGLLFGYWYLQSPRTVPAPLPSATATVPTASPALKPTVTPTATPDGPRGKIALTCQLSAQQYHDQICIMNADGSGYHRLTFDDLAENYYPSFAPDGQSLVYASNQTGSYEIYELNLSSDTPVQLTHNLGEVAGPAIAPDGRHIVFAVIIGQYSRIWLMDRDGGNPHEVYGHAGADSLDPTWSPDGSRILFASGVGTEKQLFTIASDGSDPQPVDTVFHTRGRTDWSRDGAWLASYAGSPWKWNMFLLHADGSGLKQIQVNGVALAPAFSPDGQWIVFTGYLDNPGNPDGCEIYVMKLNGNQVTRLTYNPYCDWQPRWGP
jgi:TolB protein